jgi:two-component system response regulator DesR
MVAVAKILLAHHGALTRGAIAVVLRQERDIEVVAECRHGDELLDLARRVQPDIAIVDVDIPVTGSLPELCEELTNYCAVLVMAEPRSGSWRCVDVAGLAPRLGVIAKECAPNALIDGVRRLLSGETVFDSTLALAALAAGRNPFTDRERQVINLVDAGLTTRDIAKKLFLSEGTVRNHLSRVLAKTGARTRIEAIRTARDSGWL